MSKIEVTTQAVEFPEGTVSAGVHVVLHNTDGSVLAEQTIAQAPYDLTIDASIPAGSYNAVAYAIDQAGNPIGAKINSVIEVKKVLVDIPLSITVVAG